MTIELERPTVSFFLLEDGTVVFEFLSEDGTEVEVHFDDSEYVYGVALNFHKAAVLMSHLNTGADFDGIAQDLGGIYMNTDNITNINDIQWEDPQ